jgi:hypothetical protein
VGFQQKFRKMHQLDQVGETGYEKGVEAKSQIDVLKITNI